ncbi:hypothetical protein BC831DRAFT_471658 [Entophlyctis helioformis]|nr:hypothetical protein BC831DRAFT_471658 [Entophlyctis helioformis]
MPPHGTTTTTATTMPHLRSLALVGLTVSLLASSLVAAQSCANPKTHAEWRELTAAQQQAYVAAVACLKTRPSQLGQTSRFDDLVWIHSQANNVAHETAAFLPWHRLYLSLFDRTLETECNYAGPFPYWDWSFDAQAPERSEVWSRSAFGGNGRGSRNCVMDGPFAATRASRDCVHRRWSTEPGQFDLPMLGAFYAPETINFMMRYESYDPFRRSLESLPHNNVHMAIGGDMGNARLSPNDPIFMLHHRNIDRIWYRWQRRHPQQASMYSGNLRRGSSDNNARATDTLNMFGYLSTNPTVADVLSSTGGGAGGLVCFQYTNSIRPRGRVLTDDQARQVVSGVRRANTNDNIDDSDTNDDSNDSSDRGSSGSPFNPKTPGPHDRTDMYNLRVSEPLSDDFLRRWNYSDTSIAQIRLEEQQMRLFVAFVNQVSGYVSKTCLGRVHSGLGENGGEAWQAKTDDEEQTEQMIMDMLVEGARQVAGFVRDTWPEIRDELVDGLASLGINVGGISVGGGSGGIGGHQS